MGLNFERIAQMKLAAAIEAESKTTPVAVPPSSVPVAAVAKGAPQSAPIPSSAKAVTLASLAALDALAAPVAKAVANAAPVESAGTINFHQVSAQIIELGAALKAAHPKLPNLLQEVWNTLDKYPECVTLLSEDEMEIIVAGLEKQTGTELAAITLKNITKGSKKTPISGAMLGF